MEFDNFGIEWEKRLFNKENGGYSVAHSGHNIVPNDFSMADDIANSGKKVKLRNEKVGDPNFGGKTPDAEIDDFVYDFKNFDSPNDVNGKVYIRIKEAGERSNAPGVVFNLKGNSASLSDVNIGLKGIIDFIQTEGIPPTMAEKVGLIYSDGSVKFLTKNEIINGAIF
jgi:hypothetical protein